MTNSTPSGAERFVKRKRYEQRSGERGEFLEDCKQHYTIALRCEDYILREEIAKFLGRISEDNVIKKRIDALNNGATLSKFK